MANCVMIRSGPGPGRHAKVVGRSGPDRGGGEVDDGSHAKVNVRSAPSIVRSVPSDVRGAPSDVTSGPGLGGRGPCSGGGEVDDGSHVKVDVRGAPNDVRSGPRPGRHAKVVGGSGPGCDRWVIRDWRSIMEMAGERERPSLQAILTIGFYLINKENKAESPNLGDV